VMEEAFVLAKRSGRPTNLMRAYNNIAAARTRSRGPVAVVDVVEEGLNLALRSGIYANAGWITGTLGDTLHLIGRLEEAEEHLAKAVELARRIGDMPLIGMRLSSLAMTVLFRGRVEEALAIWTEARPIVVANPEPQIESWEPMFESYVAYARGDASLAADRAVAAADTARTYGIAGAPEVIPLVVRSLLRVDRPDLAAGYRDLDDLDGVVDAALARNVQGLIEREAMRSASILGEAAEMLDALGMSLLAGLARVDRARAIARAGDDPRPTLEQARDLIETCDARLFLPEVDAALVIASP
jgi:tetratricopeptide (TPR) repeat protein